jgi:ubiquinone/menaquinone biosynthesis C-methylase UbiE
MERFDASLEQECWAARSAEPPFPEELDSLEQDMRLWVPDFPGLFAGKRILDLGAGRCPLGVLTAQRFDPALVVSIDLGYHRLHAAADFNRRLPAFHVVCGDAFRLPFPDEHFDYVIANSFLHHLPNLNEAVREFTRVLRRGGSYIGREPNFNNPVVRTHVFRFSGTWIRRGEQISANEYPLRAEQIVSSFSQAGCECGLHYFWRRWRSLHHPLLSIAISVRARRL